MLSRGKIKVILATNPLTSNTTTFLFVIIFIHFPLLLAPQFLLALSPRSISARTKSGRLPLRSKLIRDVASSYLSLWVQYVKAGVVASHTGTAHIGIPIIDPLIGQDYNGAMNQQHRHQRQLFTQIHQNARLLVNKNIFQWHQQTHHHHHHHQQQQHQWWWESSTPPSSVDLEWEHEGIHTHTNTLWTSIYYMPLRCIFFPRTMMVCPNPPTFP